MSPDERAVFVLHEVFGFSHDEIASTIGKSAAAVRQMAHRAREHVQSRRKRFEPVDPKQSMEITARFFAAASTGDVDGLMEMLSPRRGVDRGQRRQGQRGAPTHHRRRSGRQADHRPGPRGRGQSGRIEPAMYNNAPALKLYLGDSFEGVITVEITEGRISHFYAMRNPDKLTGVDIPREISR